MIVLPNGCVLRPGGRVRILRSQLSEIPIETIDRYGLTLDDERWSPDSEVIQWKVIL